MSASETVRLLVPEAREGSLLAGKYLIEETIGSGGMGVVMAARHLDLDERVAIKFLQPEVAHDTEAVSRFAREAWAASKIKSEYVARVSDVGKLESGVPYIVMEYLEGLDLAQLLRTRGPMPLEQAVEFVMQACEAIAEAHALGIVHRDLKPSNLFCVRRSDGLLAIKVLDFGISKVTRPLGKPVDISITTTASTVGSPLYMAPEQMSSAKVADERVDVWALGVILHQLLTAFPPFYAETLPELAIKIATEAPTPLRSRRPDAPRGLERIVLRCLEKDRMRRYPDVADLAHALMEFGPGRAGMHAERAERVLRASGRYGAVRAEGSPAQASTRARRSSQSGWEASRSHRLVWPLLVAALVALGLGALAWTRYLQSEPRARQRASRPPPTAVATPAVGDHAPELPGTAAPPAAAAVPAPAAEPPAEITNRAVGAPAAAPNTNTVPGVGGPGSSSAHSPAAQPAARPSARTRPARSNTDNPGSAQPAEAERAATPTPKPAPPPAPPANDPDELGGRI